jgi:aspartate/methionine/tyrosine aminotransferase
LQAILLRLLRNREALVSYLKTARDIYRQRRDALQEALSEVSDLADWSLPDAGLFFWVRVRAVDDVYNMVCYSLNYVLLCSNLVLLNFFIHYDNRSPLSVPVYV